MQTVLASVDWGIIKNRIFHPDSTFAWALWKTVYIAVVSQIIGVSLGLVAALFRMSRLAPLRLFSGLYVLVFRGTPVIVQIFFVSYGANLLFGFDLIPRTVNLGLFTLDGAILAGIIALSFNEGAYMREIIRAGIDSIDRGQTEAAKSLGMPPGLTMRRVVLPQAARVIIPPLGNEFNNMLKTTSLLAFIGVTEMFQNAEIHYSNDFKPVGEFAAVAFWYLVLTTIWTFIQAWIERKLAADEHGDAIPFRERWMHAFAPVHRWRLP